MAINPRQLRVAEAVRLLNATPLGEVVQPSVITRHLSKAAYQIGDGQRIDIARYAAWLFHERRGRASTDGATYDPGAYDRHREAMNARSKVQSESSRDIAADGWIHETRNVARRSAARTSFRLFCETYFPVTFHLAWSPDHLKVIAKIEEAVLHGGLFAMAMPRGSGKTTLCEVACLWSLLYGHREFIALIGSDEEHAEGMLDSIKTEIENNDLLEEDFSEICGPVRALEGIHQRAAGQLYRGARTHIGWTAKDVTLPCISGSEGGGGVIRVAGITGRIRGMKHKRADGRTVRPSLVLLDDPQTDESARSPSQCATREQILAGAILGLAGPGRKIAGLAWLDGEEAVATLSGAARRRIRRELKGAAERESKLLAHQAEAAKIALLAWCCSGPWAELCQAYLTAKGLLSASAADNERHCRRALLYPQPGHRVCAECGRPTPPHNFGSLGRWKRVCDDCVAAHIEATNATFERDDEVALPPGLRQVF